MCRTVTMNSTERQVYLKCLFYYVLFANFKCVYVMYQYTVYIFPGPIVPAIFAIKIQIMDKKIVII